MTLPAAQPSHISPTWSSEIRVKSVKLKAPIYILFIHICHYFVTPYLKHQPNPHLVGSECSSSLESEPWSPASPRLSTIVAPDLSAHRRLLRSWNLDAKAGKVKHLGEHGGLTWFTLWKFNIAIEHGPSIVDLHGFTYYKRWFSIAMLVYQRVTIV